MENAVAIVDKNIQHVGWPLAEARRAPERFLLGVGDIKDSEAIRSWRKDNHRYAVAECLATLYH